MCVSYSRSRFMHNCISSFVRLAAASQRERGYVIATALVGCDSRAGSGVCARSARLHFSLLFSARTSRRRGRGPVATPRRNLWAYLAQAKGSRLVYSPTSLEGPFGNLQELYPAAECAMDTPPSPSLSAASSQRASSVHSAHPPPPKRLVPAKKPIDHTLPPEKETWGQWWKRKGNSWGTTAAVKVCPRCTLPRRCILEHRLCWADTGALVAGARDF